jgi:hypothetical protein
VPGGTRDSLESQAQEHFAAGKFTEFDGFFGDAACQMRALMITSGALDTDALLKTTCFVFKRVATPDPAKGRVIEPDTVVEQLGISKNMSKNKFIPNAQKWVSLLSVDFLRQCLNDLVDTDVILPEALDELHQSLNFIFRNKEGRFMHLCFPGLKVVLLFALVNRIPIILRVTRFCNECHCKHERQFVFESDGHRFDIVSPAQMPALIGRRALVFKGWSAPRELLGETGKLTVTVPDEQLVHPACEVGILFFDSLHELLDRIGGPVTCILANASQHEQVNFVSTVRSPEGACVFLRDKGLIDLANELESMKELARTSGCSIENPTLFFLTHVFADTIR